MTDEAKALVEREGMQVLLPPAAGVDGDYLMGWLEGQAYLISIYGTDEASDQAFTVAHQVHRMQNLIETQARENAAKDAEIERLREALEVIRRMYPDWPSERMALVRKRAVEALAGEQ